MHFHRSARTIACPAREAARDSCASNLMPETHALHPAANLEISGHRWIRFRVHTSRS